MCSIASSSSLDEWGWGRLMADEPQNEHKGDWQLWPPSPKVQILLIAAVFGLINFCLLAIWAYVMYRRFG